MLFISTTKRVSSLKLSFLYNNLFTNKYSFIYYITRNIFNEILSQKITISYNTKRRTKPNYILNRYTFLLNPTWPSVPNSKETVTYLGVIKPSRPSPIKGPFANPLCGNRPSRVYIQGVRWLNLIFSPTQIGRDNLAFICPDFFSIDRKNFVSKRKKNGMRWFCDIVQCINTSFANWVNMKIKEIVTVQNSYRIASYWILVWSVLFISSL